MRVRLLCGVLFLGGALAAGYGCSASGGGNGFTSSSSASGSGGGATAGPSSSGVGGDCVFGCTGGSTSAGQGGSQQAAIVISPADVVLAVNNGSIPTQGYTATLNGVDVTTMVTWVYDRPEVGDIGAGSVFTPTGKVGGMGKLTAAYNKAQGSTTVSVAITQTIPGGIPPAQQGPLDNPNGGPDAQMKLVYPYDQTVFPLGVLSPELQWNGAGAADVYKLELKEKYYAYTEYFTGAPPPSRHLMSETDWANFEDSGAGAQSDPVTVSITRLSGATAFQPVTQTWHIAQGKLHGSVYYWELPDLCGNQSNGRVLRIKPDSTVTDQFFPNATCYGCHTVSRDGKTMMAAFSNGSPFPQWTIDLTSTPAKLGSIQQNAGLAGTFSAFNDKSDKIVVSNDAASNPSGSILRIVDAKSGVVLNNNAMGAGCGEAAWSPDGKHIAAICSLGGGGWIFDATQGNLNIADVDASGTIVNNNHAIVQQASVSTGRPAYPSFSPGSEHIAFGNPDQGSRSTGNGNLWIVDIDGKNLKKLTTASSDNKSYNPVFAPLRAGGYFWLVYITRRDYGNRLVGASRQQLWITAIDDPPTAADPSHPPFYMRGQEDCGKSENAYYALDPCKAVGEGCTSGVDCCNGQCVKDPQTNMYVCGMPPMPGSCSEDGNSCKTNADCCDPSAKCVDGFCTPPIPH